jgi:hypothetical protein
MIEGSGSVSLTSGSGSRRPKNLLNRIPNTASINVKKYQYISQLRLFPRYLIKLSGSGAANWICGFRKERIFDSTTLHAGIVRNLPRGCTRPEQQGVHTAHRSSVETDIELRIFSSNPAPRPPFGFKDGLVVELL